MKKWISTLAYAALLSPLSVLNAQQAFTGIYGTINVGVVNAEGKLTQSLDLTRGASDSLDLVNLGNPLKLSDFWDCRIKPWL